MDKLVERWRKVPVAVAADVSDGRCLIDPAIRPLLPPGQQPKLFGTAVTAICTPADIGAVVRALDVIKPGNVLVIDAQGRVDHAMIGEILGGHIKRKGAVGIVCDGAVRDVAEFPKLGLSVFARSITPRGPNSLTQGELNGVATIGGRKVGPGDLIIGDDDGLCSMSIDDLALIDKAEAKLALEDEWQRKLKSGETAAEVFGISR